MKTFKHFPEEKTCPICGKNDDKECVLIPIDGKDEGKICQAEVFHADCIVNAEYRYNREINAIYYKIKE